MYTICGITRHEKDIVRNHNPMPGITGPVIDIDAGGINDGLIEGVMLNGDVVDMFPMFYSNSIDLVFTIRTCSIDDIVLDRYVMDTASWDFCTDGYGVILATRFRGPPDGVVMDSNPTAELTIVQLGVDVDSLATMMARQLNVIMMRFTVCTTIGEYKVYFSNISEGVIADDRPICSTDRYSFVWACIVLDMVEGAVVDIDVRKGICSGHAFFVEPDGVLGDVVERAVLNNDVVAASTVGGCVRGETLF